jgi:peroxiredoxin Q/BCP
MKLLFGLLMVTGVAAGFLWYRHSQAGDMLQAGQAAPAFNLADQNGKSHALADYQGKWLILYFYPKDDTPGCTKEACSFRDDIAKLHKLGAEVVGVSLDSAESHAKFAEKYGLPFPLLADETGAVTDQYGALQDLGVAKFAKRYTYLIDPEGKIRKVYEKVNPSKHAGEIIADLQQLQGS